MSNLNLLPWRAELRARQKKQFATTLGLSALAGALVSVLVFSYYGAHISGQEDRNAYLEQQISNGEKKIEEIKELDEKKHRLLSRKEVIDTLQADRSRIVRLFESLVKTTPDGVVLTMVKQDESGMVITGRSQSSTKVSTYMRNLEASGWIKKPELSVIEATTPPPGFEFFPFEFNLVVSLAKSSDVPAAAIIDPTLTTVDQLITDPQDSPPAPAIVDQFIVDPSPSSSMPVPGQVDAPASPPTAAPTSTSPPIDPAVIK